MRSRSNLLFSVFCMVLLVMFLQIYSYFREYFSEARDLVARNSHLQEDVEREKLRAALVQNQLTDLRQDVAQILPNQAIKVSNEADFRLAQLSQTLRMPASDRNIDLSSVMMERAREDFRNQKFERAAQTFREVLFKYPTSAQLIDAHFLLGESLFQAGKYDECLDVVYEMVNQFPDNEMTGYLMLRDAQILETRKRGPEASEIYNIVMREFSGHPALKEQARKLAGEK